MSEHRHTSDHRHSDLQLLDRIAEAAAGLEGQLVLTQSRCVDLMLDLWNLTDRPMLRSLIERHLAPWRRLGAVPAIEVRAALDELTAGQAVEAFFDRYELPTAA